MEPWAETPFGATMKCVGWKLTGWIVLFLDVSGGSILDNWIWLAGNDTPTKFQNHAICESSGSILLHSLRKPAASRPCQVSNHVFESACCAHQHPLHVAKCCWAPVSPGPSSANRCDIPWWARPDLHWTLAMPNWPHSPQPKLWARTRVKGFAQRKTRRSGMPRPGPAHQSLAKYRRGGDTWHRWWEQRHGQTALVLKACWRDRELPGHPKWQDHVVSGISYSKIIQMKDDTKWGPQMTARWTYKLGNYGEFKHI